MLSVVMPVYNEGENILPTLSSLYAEVKTPKVVHLVYDFEEDSTLPVIKKNLNRFPGLILTKNKYGRGVLNAIKSGIEAAEGDAVLVTMADGSDEYAIVDQMYGLVKKGNSVVCASRYMKGGRQIGGPLLKRTLSRLAGLSAYYLTRIPTHDLSNNFRMYDKRFLDSITIESEGGFEIATELTAKAFKSGKMITELPTTWRDRAAGKSNFKLWKWLPRYLHWYFYLWK
ncbi:glycosyltransferase family 2 protein [Candidatus Saganbacteria bacterium]|nr:glycosyltransferase family 2 protein [Candidatus Saganbacteria bacterium]